ncbi:MULTISPECIES: GNAT family N-acetyltransferase [Anaerostipes]|uniref:N-acetyltransferase n=1 Tax=Anaerostipes butyraticus TaxID=645466 RepID=A0A916Q6K0_9FIRM|nr:MULTISPECIES: GNAT family N-acetyltransferase [Anaerostipes]GFO85187.1 N-acetyltransferase [Anaerostipes butyraticus]HJC82332.1 GNAT family N-acetyltransferase [Candidatus Anaerostipes avicola]
MLEKSLPYSDIIMKADHVTASTWKPAYLPDGYSFKMYEEGDETAWADLETSVKEFSSREEALAYFQKVFLPHRRLLPFRMCFVVDEDNRICATASAWMKTENGCYWPILHWVSTAPDVQGKGIGHAVISYALSLFSRTDPGKAVFLHTQTWSYRAVSIYYQYGFRITKSPLSGVQTDFRYQETLQGVLPESILNDIVE